MPISRRLTTPAAVTATTATAFDMSMSGKARSSSQSTRSSNRSNRSLPAPVPSLTPSTDGTFEACAATANYFIYAQRNLILCLHHTTLAIERRFERHREHVQWITADNVSERGSGRTVVSYDASQTTIVWDLLTGDETARFASFEEIKVAAFMRNGNIAFGNSQGNVILFEPSTVEHISARTIFDPITALAPAVDCRTFAIGYMNGSILIATLQPSFTILHTLSTTRAPTPMNGLAWHGSSSKQKSDMLAAQTADGDLRIWSIPKHNTGDPPSIIRVLHLPDNDRISGPCWFGWSKMGRIVQYSDGLTFVWDVRTKRVTYESVPTVDGIVGIANYGAGATLFTLGRNHTVQQYDLNPNARAPQLVQNVQHVPASLPPSPPISDGEQGRTMNTVTAGASDPRAIYFDAESGGEEGVMTISPLQKIAQEMDQYEDERRDRLGALSPVSSRSSLSSRSAGHRAPRRHPKPQSSSRPHLAAEKPPSPGIFSASSSYGTGTTFSSGAYRNAAKAAAGRESVSIRTMSSNSSMPRGSRLREELPRSPEETQTLTTELFPFTKARLSDVPFVPPVYDHNRRTPDDLRRQMLKVVFGWPDDIDSLIRAEISQHLPGSPSAVLLAKWLGDLEAEAAASMVGSASLSSSDWMLLALSAMGNDSQKKVGEAFVERLLAKGDIHPAVAILLGLGEPDEAVEAYVSRRYFMEAVLLTCLVSPLDWGRQSHLVRRWGEQLVSEEPKQPELAVRCFSCTSVESSEPWFSPRAQDAVYAAQQAILGPSPPRTGVSSLSPASATQTRLNPAQAGLKLITNFAPPQNLDPTTVIDDRTPITYSMGGATPIDSAVLSPQGGYYMRAPRRGEPASAASGRTATPGGYARKRYPSRGALDRLRNAEVMTPPDAFPRSGEPMTAFKDRAGGPEVSYPSTAPRTRSASTGQPGMFSPVDQIGHSLMHEPQVDAERGRGLPSPSNAVFKRMSGEVGPRNGSRNRNREGLTLSMDDIVVVDPSLKSGTQTAYSILTGSAITGQSSIHTGTSRRTAQSADAELKSSKIRSIDEYINSLEATQNFNRDAAGSSRQRLESRERRAARRAPSEGRGRQNVRYVKPAKRSPSSPISMSPDDPALLSAANATAFDDERYYKLIAPVKAEATQPSEKIRGPDATSNTARAESKSRRRTESKERSRRLRSTSRPAGKQASRPHSPVGAGAQESRGRSKIRGESSRRERSGGSARPKSPAERGKNSQDTRERSRARSAKRQRAEAREASSERPHGGHSSRPSMPRLITDLSNSSAMSKKELAAQELEARRLSLARRPSAPAIPHPDDLANLKSGTSDEQAVAPSPVVKSSTGSPGFVLPSDYQLRRSNSVDPEILLRPTLTAQGISTPSAPIGLPATPRAMRHPKYIGGSSDDAPKVPLIPDSFVQAAAGTVIVSGEPSPDNHGPSPIAILPATTFQPSRSASAPAEKMFGYASKPEFRPYPVRQASNDYQAFQPPGSGGESPLRSPGIGSIEQTLANSEQASQDIIIVEASPGVIENPPVLPELQHLAAPLPPPPPPPPLVRGNTAPAGTGFVEVVDPRHPTPAAMSRQQTPNLDVPQPPSAPTSPQSHRRGRGSVSETVSQKIRNVTNRLRDRSTSRNRATIISPPQPLSNISAPYESMQTSGPPLTQRRGSKSTGQGPVMDTGPGVAPYDSAYAATAVPADLTAGTSQAPHETLPASSFGGYRNPKEIARQLTPGQVQYGAEAVAAAAQAAEQPKNITPYTGYRNPKEIRANMPPTYTQAGVIQGPAAESEAK